MLNEIKEYEQYTILPATPKESRLACVNFLKKTKDSVSLSGLERAMTTIARYYLFNLNLDETSVEEVLKAWCGFNHNENIAEISRDINGWLKRLIQLMKTNKSNAEKADLALEKLSNKNKQFGKSPLNTNSIENNFKEITYEGVIANALTMGRLENYCLICNGNDFETYLQTNSSKIDCDLLCKAIAYYLLQKQFAGQKYVYFNETDLGNWMSKRGDKLKFKTFLAKDTNVALFEKKSLYGSDKGKNIVKYKVQEDFLTKFKFAIIKQSEIDKIDRIEYPNLVIYEDEGSGVPLKVNRCKTT